MRKCWKITVLMPYVGLLILCNAAWAFSGVVGPVQGIHAVSGHEINRPSQETIIEMVWSLPDGYTQESIEGYYFKFDSLSDDEFEPFNQSNTVGLLLTKNQTAISQDYITVFPDDLYVFFHIVTVVLDEEEEPVFGPTQTMGPFRIDVTAPKNVWVSAPEETSNRNIVLNLGAETSNIEMYISNMGYGESGSGWEPFVVSKEWTLSDGEGEKSIYVEFRDDAGNISKASTTSVYKTSDPLSAHHSCEVYLAGTDVTISNSISYTGTFSLIKYLMELPPGWQMISTSIDQDNYTVLDNGNIEYSWENLASDVGQDMPFTSTIAVPYGEIGEKNIQSLVTYQLDGSSLMNEYAQPNPLLVAQKEQYYSMTVQYGENGTVSLSDSVVSHGESVEFQIIPEEGYEIDQLSINNEPLTLTGNTYLVDHSVENIHLIVTFKRIEFDITVISGENGTVVPGSQTVFYGNSLTVNITPDRGYRVSSLILNDEPLQLTQHTIILASIKKNYILNVSFEKIPETMSVIHETEVFFIPGSEIDVDLEIVFTGFLTALGCEIQLPDGFEYRSVEAGGGSLPEVQYNALTNKLSFAWFDLASEKISVTYKVLSPMNATGKVDLIGTLKYRFTDQTEIIQTENTGSQAVEVLAKHTNLTGPYDAGEELSVSNTIAYTGNISELILEVTLPEGWEYLRATGTNVPDSEPTVGENDQIVFKWTTIPENIAFVYFLKSADTSTDTVDIQSILYFVHENNDPLQVNMLPKQLLIEPAYVNATQNASKTYVAGLPFIVNNVIDYNGELANLAYHVEIPDGWEYTTGVLGSIPDDITATAGQIDFAWTSIPQSPINFTYQLIPDAYTETAKNISATVLYQRLGDRKSVPASPAVLTVTEGKFLVSHSVLSDLSGGITWYTPGQKITMNNTIQYSDEFFVDDNNPNRLAALGYRVGLPEGWSFLSNTGGMIVETPEYGIEFSWAQPPQSPIQFSYTLQISEDAEGVAEIAAMAVYRIGDESHGENIEPAYPDPLILYNIQAPTVNIHSNLSSPTASNAIPMTVTFSKPVSGFQASDLLVSNGSIFAFAGGPSVYTFKVTPEQDGNVSVNIPQNSAFDQLGNGNEPATPFEIMVDQTQPTVSIASSIPEFSKTSPWVLTILFSEPVLNFVVNDISTTNNAIVESFDNSGNPVFIVHVVPNNQGEVSISIPSAIAVDIAGNKNVQSVPYVRTYDSMPPELEIQGSEILRIEVGETYIDQGAVAIDTIDGDISNQIQVDNQVNDQLVGQYKVIYEISDRAGNEQVAERTVFVDPDQVTPTVQTDASGYLPGNDYIVSVKIRFKTGCTAMGYELELPDGWSFDSVWGTNVPDVIRLDKDNILGFAWAPKENFKSLESLSFIYALQVPENASGRYVLPANVKYRYTDQSELQVDATIIAFEQSVIAIHSSKDVYLPGHSVPIDVDIHLSTDTDTFNTFTAVGLIVHLPENWTFDHAYGDSAPVSAVTGIVPDQGSSGTLQFAWFNISSHTISFTYDVIPPSGANSSEMITATVKYRFSNGIERSTQLLPKDLLLEPAVLSVEHHCETIYIPNMELPVDTIITYNGSSDTLSNMQLSLSIPENWALTKMSGTGQPSDIVKNGNSILFKWIDNIPSSPIVFSYVFIPGTPTGTDDVSISSELSYYRFDKQLTEKAIPDPITITGGDFVARQSMILPSSGGVYFYTPGSTVTINHSIVYSGDLQNSDLKLSVTIPENWTYVDSSSNIEPGITDNQLIFEWETAPVSPISFSYQLQIPSTESGKKLISAVIEYLAGSQSVQVLPNPLRVYDNLAPVPQIQSNLGVSSAVSPMELTLVFSKPVSGLEKGDFALQNGVFNTLQAINAYTYKLNLSPINQGPVNVELPANRVKDYLGKGNIALTPSFSVIYDSIAPEIAYLGSSASSTTNSSLIPITLTLTEPVFGFSSNQLNVSNGTIANFQGSGNQYTFNIIPGNQGEILIAVNAGVLKDNAGNSNQFQQSFQRVYDTVRPTVSLGVDPDERTLNTIQPITLTVQMSEKVRSFEQTDIVIQNGSIHTFQMLTEGLTYQAVIYPLECGFMTLKIPEGAATDEAGNTSLSSETIPLTLNCTTYSGRVKDDDLNALEDVNVNVVYPEISDVQVSKTDADGRYSLVLPKLLSSDKYFFNLEKTGYVPENKTFSMDSDAPVGFKVELEDQTMRTISEIGYAYTITGKVLAEGKAINLITSNPVVKVYTVHPNDNNQESQSTVAKNDGSFFIGFDTVPSFPFVIVASMKDYYADKDIIVPSSENIILDMQLPEAKEQISVNVSVDYGADVKVQNTSGLQTASIKIQPKSIDKSAKIEMKIIKTSATHASKSEGQLLEITLAAEIINDLVIDFKISDDISEQDLLSGKYFIFYAQTLESFLSGAVSKIPTADIVPSAQMGYVKFKVRHLTVFGVGQDIIDDDLPRLKPDISNTSQRRCFISTVQTTSVHSLLIFIVLTIMIGAIGLIKYKVSSFNLCDNVN
ncbi:MAG: DUF5011 domain-containing protein [Candidatus Magnetomorum sp.]|nr:DUF5011 domain-containing protein [Candidatus Magnetomorum sp.]